MLQKLNKKRSIIHISWQNDYFIKILTGFDTVTSVRFESRHLLYCHFIKIPIRGPFYMENEHSKTWIDDRFSPASAIIIDSTFNYSSSSRICVFCKWKWFHSCFYYIAIASTFFLKFIVHDFLLYLSQQYVINPF